MTPAAQRSNIWFRVIKTWGRGSVVWPRLPGATGERWAARAGKTPGKWRQQAELPPPPSQRPAAQWTVLSDSAGDREKMVSVVDGDCGSEAGLKRRRMSGSSPPGDALTPARPRRSEARHRKQKLISRLSDSGFQEDLGSSPVSSPAETLTVSPLRVQEPAAGQQLSGSWFLQYGDIGFSVQREREEHFHPCRSLARQPQVGRSRQ